jgi:hypothetical protein
MWSFECLLVVRNNVLENKNIGLEMSSDILCSEVHVDRPISFRGSRDVFLRTMTPMVKKIALSLDLHAKR